MRSDRDRRAALSLVHRFDIEVAVADDTHGRFAATWIGTARATLDQLGHMHGRALFKIAHQRNGGKHAGIAGPAGYHDIGSHLNRTLERLVPPFGHTAR